MAVTIENALNLIYKTIKPTKTKLLPIESALGLVLAQDVMASYNLPPYDNSAMDGYAVKLADASKTIKVEHTIFAGDNSDKVLENGFGIKIMTGAKIPKGTECIVPMEDTQQAKDGATLPSNLKLNKHVRFAGEDIKIGEKLLSCGDRLDAHQITILASQGISHIKVYKKPKMALFSSGNELKMHFEDVKDYQLYNTNSPTFMARALELGCEVDFIGTAKDTLEEIQEHIKSALDADFILTSGGISVGEADFTREAFAGFGYDVLFDKVEIKPGKPTTFGTIKDKYILNLPGNPLAASLNFELFGQAIISALSGESAKYTNTIKAKLKDDYKIKAGRRTLVPGIFDGEFFTPCKNFAPGMIKPLSVSNSFIMVDENSSTLKANQTLNIISTKFNFKTKESVSLTTS